MNSLDSETLAYNQILAIVESMIAKKSIKNFIALKNLNWLIASYQRRILNALYHNKVQKSKRLSILLNINWGYYIKHINSNSINEKIQIALLKKHHYRLYDFIRSIVILIRKIKLSM